MTLKTLSTLAMITLLPVSCIQKDKPITPELAELLHNRKMQGESLASRENKAPAIFDILSSIKKNRDDQKDTTDSLGQDKIIPQDSIKKVVIPTSSEKILDSLASGSLTNPENSKEATESLSQEHTLLTTPEKALPYLESRRYDIATNLVKNQNTISLDTTPLQSEFKIIFLPYFSQEDNNIRFVAPLPSEQEAIAQSLGRIKNYIKGNNLSTWMRDKKDMKSYIQENRLGTIYQTLVLDKNFTYTGGAQQFEKDIAVLFRLYE